MVDQVCGTDLVVTDIDSDLGFWENLYSKYDRATCARRIVVSKRDVQSIIGFVQSSTESDVRKYELIVDEQNVSWKVFGEACETEEFDSSKALDFVMSGATLEKL